MQGNKTYIVRLEVQERDDLRRVVRTGRAAAYRRTHAQILLHCDEGLQGPSLSDRCVAEAVGVGKGTVRNVRKRFVEQGLESALGRKMQKNPSVARKLDGKQEARLIAMACGPPPKGRAKWTLHLLSEQLVALEVVDSISYETVRRTLKKTNSSHT